MLGSKPSMMRALALGVVGAMTGSVAFALTAGALTGTPPSAPGFANFSSTSKIFATPRTGDGLATDGKGHLFATSNGNVIRMNMDGSHTSTIASGFGTSSMFVRVAPNGKLWVGSYFNSDIYEMNTDGSNKHTVITGLSSYPDDVAFDGFGHVYVSSEGGGIWKMSMDGSNRQQIVTSAGHDVWALSYDHAGHLYFANGYQHGGYRVNLDGSGLTEVVTGGTTLESVNVLPDRHIIWSDYGAGTLFETNADGSNPLTIASSLSTPETTIVTPGAIYFASWDGGVFRTAYSPAAVPGINSATVYWAASAATDVAISSYTVIATPVNGGVTLEQTVPGNQTSATFYGLINAQEYQFSVFATNIFGDSPYSYPSNTVNPGPEYPDAPSAPSATGVGGGAKVSWSAPNSHGSALTAYVVAAYRVGTETAAARVTVAAGATSVVVSGLVNGTGYQFSVLAINGIGVSSTSPLSGVIVPAGPPSWSSSPTATALSKAARVSWSPANANGSAVTGYKVISSPGAHTCTTAGALACTVTGLKPGVTYRFKVVATNHHGASPASPASNAVVVKS